MDKQERLTELYREYMKDFKGEEIVTGCGNANSKLIFVGEAPGRDEVRLSKPFVGIAGKNLNELLEVLGLEREAIYITNAIKYRLSKINPQSGRVVNRPATREEINMNRKYLLNEINIIDPWYVVTLGNVPLRSITGDGSITVGSAHGVLEKLIISGREYSLFPLYHPASIIYNRNLKDICMNDTNKLKEIIIAT